MALAMATPCQPLLQELAGAAWSCCCPGPPLVKQGPDVPRNLWSGAAAVAASVLRQLASTTDENVDFFTNLKMKSLFGFIYWKLLIG